MNKEAFDLHTCSLEMKGGLESGIDYPQKFVRAPLSQHPSPAPSSGKETPHSEAMRITMGR
jgi:hypothetical protein